MEVEVASRRIGVFGGTFDPIHIGHLVIAEEARVAYGLERVVFVPARISPHKLGVTPASGEDRCEMVRLAVHDNPAFDVSRVDLDRAGPSFTVDTLRSLHAEYGSATQLYFVMGADSLLAFKAWHKPKEILRLTRLIVVTRPGYALDLAALDRELPGIAAATGVLDSISLDISATDLRARVRQGRPIRYQVPCAVARYIAEHQLYAADQA
ncbi:MAG: nicotinate-nucleotide adenylyltransferase [Chloroflexi bacterium]|nr:nicotinate-nucleotide adenylyltransferase [Chloroflexota bacterium]